MHTTLHPIQLDQFVKVCAQCFRTHADVDVHELAGLIEPLHMSLHAEKGAIVQSESLPEPIAQDEPAIKHRHHSFLARHELCLESCLCGLVYVVLSVWSCLCGLVCLSVCLSVCFCAFVLA